MEEEDSLNPTVHPGIVSVLEVEANEENPTIWRRNSRYLASLNHLDDRHQLITKEQECERP